MNRRANRRERRKRRNEALAAVRMELRLLGKDDGYLHDVRGHPNELNLLRSTLRWAQAHLPAGGFKETTVGRMRLTRT